jgi:hypothetical protein
MPTLSNVLKTPGAPHRDTCIPLKKGAYLIETKRVVIELEKWISRAQAQSILKVSRWTVVRWTEEIDPITRKPYLTAYRPAPSHSLLILAESVVDLLQATQSDPEFWDKRKALKARLRR